MTSPLQKIQQRVNELLGLVSDTGLRYLLNSGHDDQIANLLWWLSPVDYEFTDVPYASQVLFELYYDTDCLANGSKDE